MPRYLWAVVGFLIAGVAFVITEFVVETSWPVALAATIVSSLLAMLVFQLLQPRPG